MDNSIRKTSLLILEDEPDLAQVLEEALNDVADNLWIAYDGAEALKIVETRPIDAILADFQVPKLTGLQLIEKLLQMKTKIPVVMHTAHATPDLMMKATLYGVLRFVSKPANLEELRAVLQKAVAMGFRIRHIDEELEAVCEANTIPMRERPAYKKQIKDERILEIMTEALGSSIR